MAIKHFTPYLISALYIVCCEGASDVAPNPEEYSTLVKEWKCKYEPSLSVQQYMLDEKYFTLYIRSSTFRLFCGTYVLQGAPNSDSSVKVRWNANCSADIFVWNQSMRMTPDTLVGTLERNGNRAEESFSANLHLMHGAQLDPEKTR